MDSFFDTSVVIHYASFSERIELNIIKKCHDYIINKNGKYILCFYVESEIKNRIKKRRIVYDEALRKIKDISYEIGNSNIAQELNERDIADAKKIYEAYKGGDIVEISKLLGNEQIVFERKLDQFLKFYVDEKVIRLETLEEYLVNVLLEVIVNYADCKVLASAIQAQKERTLFYFVTADKHFDPNGYVYLKEEPRLAKMKFPELKNLYFEK